MRVLMLVMVLCAMTLTAEPPAVTEAKDKLILEEFLAQAGKVAEILNSERCREAAKEDAEETEAYLWQLLPYLRMPLAA